jgi:hypothetical protein
MNVAGLFEYQRARSGVEGLYVEISEPGHLRKFF